MKMHVAAAVLLQDVDHFGVAGLIGDAHPKQQPAIGDLLLHPFGMTMPEYASHQKAEGAAGNAAAGGHCDGRDQGCPADRKNGSRADAADIGRQTGDGGETLHA